MFVTNWCINVRKTIKWYEGHKQSNISNEIYGHAHIISFCTMDTLRHFTLHGQTQPHTGQCANDQNHIAPIAKPGNKTAVLFGPDPYPYIDIYIKYYDTSFRDFECHISHIVAIYTWLACYTLKLIRRWCINVFTKRLALYSSDPYDTKAGSLDSPSEIFLRKKGRNASFLIFLNTNTWIIG